MEATISRSIAKFALQFCNELEKSRTCVCSPLSAETVLALLALGSSGQTRAELLQALDLADDDAIRTVFKTLIPRLQSIYGARLNTANKVYVKEGGTLKPEIQKDAEEVFGAKLERLDFNNSVAAANVINKWVTENTNGRIKNIASASMMSDRTSLFLVNAIYFKALWKNQFKKHLTRKEEFHINNKETTEVPMMYMRDQTMKYSCNPELKAQILEMPYQGNESSMVIVLPDDIEGLSSILQRLANGHDLMGSIKAMENQALDITIPTFKAETTIDLKTELLPKLGIHSIFSEMTSEINMLTNNERLYVSHAVQKAYIMVNESGTEAAAATGLCFQYYCAKSERPRIEFTADRPFMFLLMASGVPVFVGAYRGGQETVPTADDVPPEEMDDFI